MGNTLRKKNKNYLFKKNYKFHKSPFFKYKSEIINTNYNGGTNNTFEVYLSYKDNKEYIASPNIYNSNIDIFLLIKNKKLKSLKGHKKNVKLDISLIIKMIMNI